MSTDYASRPSPRRQPVDFEIVGTPLDDWLGKTANEHVITAAEKALAMPDEKILVCVVNDDSAVNIANWAKNERRALARWFKQQEADTRGRMRLSVSTQLEPKTLQDVKTVTVVYQPNYRPKPRSPRKADA